MERDYRKEFRNVFLNIENSNNINIKVTRFWKSSCSARFRDAKNQVNEE